MLGVSGLELVAAAARSGIIGAFPTVNAGSADDLDRWLSELTVRPGHRDAAPVCPNLIIKQPRLEEHLACLVSHRVELVITSVGSPARVVDALHEVGCLILSDVGSLEHARKAIAAGVDGLVLLTAGAGGQTGSLNPFAFVRAVRREYDGIVVLAGGISDGPSLRAAEMLGCDLGYLGTRFIASRESMASSVYKDMVVRASMDDVVLTSAFTGLPANILRESIERVGLDASNLDEAVQPDDARSLYGPAGGGPRRWIDILSAGHSVSAVERVSSVEQLLAQLDAEYHAAAPNGRR